MQRCGWGMAPVSSPAMHDTGSDREDEWVVLPIAKRANKENASAVVGAHTMIPQEHPLTRARAPSILAGRDTEACRARIERLLWTQSRSTMQRDVIEINYLHQKVEPEGEWIGLTYSWRKR